jgi:hypothetical protein
VFIGEWVNDMPKAGVYSEVVSAEEKKKRETHFEDEYCLPEIP